MNLKKNKKKIKLFSEKPTAGLCGDLILKSSGNNPGINRNQL